MPRGLLVPLCLSAALVTGCSAGKQTGDPAALLPSPTLTSIPSDPTAAPSAPAVRVVTALYSEGEVTVDEPRVQTSLGEQVVLRISSDVTEQVHVHGYDLYVDVPAGGSVDIPITLTLPGSYEVELHGAGRPLLQLRTA